ncbi:MAG: hypothetical protein ACREMF_08890 [Gemmatimonadales bacterium]
MTLLDEIAPTYDVAARYHTLVRAPAPVVYAALWRVDLGASRLIRLLFVLRHLPARLRGAVGPARSEPRPHTLRDLTHRGFGLVGERPGNELVLGTVGRFWRLTGELRAATPADFRAPLEHGHARAAWGFRVMDRGDGTTELSTETRVQSADPATRRRFRLYWAVVGPASGWIRITMLQRIRDASERSGGVG